MMDDANWTFRILSRHFGSFDWESIIRTLQSGQGAIEVQNDQPGKTFPWHIHETDETLAILEGKFDSSGKAQNKYAGLAM